MEFGYFGAHFSVTCSRASRLYLEHTSKCFSPDGQRRADVLFLERQLQWLL